MKKILKNQLHTLEITGMTADGMGVGHLDGLAVFIPGTMPGDQVSCRIVKTLKSYCFGMLLEVEMPSRDRCYPDCPHFARCGGCVYRNMSNEAEERIKYQQVADAVERIGGFPEVEIRPILGAATRNRYRNKAQLPLGLNSKGELQMGCYSAHSHRIVNMGSCLLQPMVFTMAMEAFREWHGECGGSVYHEKEHTGLLRHLYLRWGEKTGEVMVTVVINGKTLPHAQRLVELLRLRVPGITGILLNHNKRNTNVILGRTCTLLWGSETISDILCGLRFDISPLSFYQVNRSQAELLYEKAAEYAALTGKEKLLDLYCGAGTIGLSMAKQAGSLIGVEIIPEAVENARENARKNGIENAEFLCADAAEAAELLVTRGEKPDVVILDPPRKGCTPELLASVAKMSPERVVYVSCDPATLARDLRGFRELGYSPKEITPCNLFPCTAHVECVCLMTRE